jgi:hypothetical protein
VLRRYVARWLLVDVISTVPFDTLLALCGLAEAASGKLLGLSRIVRLVRRAPRIGPLKVPQSIDCVPVPAPCTLRGHSFRASATGSARTESLERLHERERLCTHSMCSLYVFACARAHRRMWPSWRALLALGSRSHSRLHARRQMRLMRLVRLIKFGRITEQLQINHLSSTGVWLRLCRLASTLLLVGARVLSSLELTRVCVVSR